MPPSLRQRAAFLWAERSLLADLGAVRDSLSRRLGRPVRLERYIRGRGWGIKYIVAGKIPECPAALVKIASRVIERRLQRVQAENYLPPVERYRQEASVIVTLAREGLGPELIESGPGWFARGFLPGRCLTELPPEELAEYLPAVLDAADRAVAAGVFHTDMNADNVIVGPLDRRVGFIDSEWPQTGPLAGLDSIAVRRYCYRRLLFTLGRDYAAAAEPAFRERILAAVLAHSGGSAGPLSREEAAVLLTGQGFTAWRLE
ncbi:hypothetical protein LLH00_00765 [bacterium]|nr:hypothetical protein [bacterium]